MTDKELATALHDKMCPYDHTDQCAWEYESWLRPKECHTRNRWLERAGRLLMFLPASQVLAFVTELQR